MLKEIVNVVNKIIPKKEAILFNSFPNVSGNVISVYKCLVNRYPDIVHRYQLIWVINDDNFDDANRVLLAINPRQKYTICKKKSLKGLWLFCRSKYILTTHNYITGVTTYGEQKNYNMWHGMPFKTIGNLIENGGEKDQLQGDYTIATSSIFQELMSKAFGIPMEKVFITGQPCNDQLFETNNALFKLGIVKEEYSKVIIWMPTYRKSAIGALHEDGDYKSLGVEKILTDYFDELNQVLVKGGYLLIIKPHPMDVTNSMHFRESENIKILHNQDLDESMVILYEVLGECDVLLSDYSSVFIDYLNTGKPMAFIFDDLKSYSISRGFNFDAPLEYLPGEKITSIGEMLAYLENMDVVNNRWDNERKKIKEEFNLYSDGRSSDRVVECIFGEQNGTC